MPEETNGGIRRNLYAAVTVTTLYQILGMEPKKEYTWFFGFDIHNPQYIEYVLAVALFFFWWRYFAFYKESELGKFTRDESFNKLFLINIQTIFNRKYKGKYSSVRPRFSEDDSVFSNQGSIVYLNYEDKDTIIRNFDKIQKIPRSKGRVDDPDNQNISIYYRAWIWTFLTWPFLRNYFLNNMLPLYAPFLPIGIFIYFLSKDLTLLISEFLF